MLLARQLRDPSSFLGQSSSADESRGEIEHAQTRLIPLHEETENGR